MILVRHGLMIVGDTMGGKTSAFKVLAGALGDMCQNKQMEEFRVRYLFYLYHGIKDFELSCCASVSIQTLMLCKKLK